MSVSFSKPSISLAAAEAAIAAGKEKAEQIGQPMSIAIVDECGSMKTFVRMEGAPLISTTVAVDKAYTSAVTGFGTGDFFDFVKDDPPLLAGFPSIPRMRLFAGGRPITEHGQVVGAVGVSGGHYSQDDEVATAILAALSDREQMS